MDIIKKLEYVKKRIENHIDDYNGLKYDTETRLNNLLDEVDVILKDEVSLNKLRSELIVCQTILRMDREEGESISSMKSRIRNTLRNDYKLLETRKLSKNTISQTYLIKRDEDAKQPVFVEMVIDTHHEVIINIKLIK